MNISWHERRSKKRIIRIGLSELNHVLGKFQSSSKKEKEKRCLKTVGGR